MARTCEVQVNSANNVVITRLSDKVQMSVTLGGGPFKSAAEAVEVFNKCQKEPDDIKERTQSIAANNIVSGLVHSGAVSAAQTVKDFAEAALSSEKTASPFLFE